MASLISDPPYGLVRQSYAPRFQSHGRVNADGWGVGFYPPELPTPVRWRSPRPIWGEASLASLAPVLTSTAIVAAVRSATVGMPIDETATAPFSCGDWLFSHNGRVDRNVLPATAAAAAESVCDAAVLAAYAADRGFERLGETVTDVGGRDPNARLNLLACDGERIFATTWGDSLSVLRADDGVAVASEPYDDDPRWSVVPPRSLVTVTALETDT